MKKPFFCGLFVGMLLGIITEIAIQFYTANIFIRFEKQEERDQAIQEGWVTSEENSSVGLATIINFLLHTKDYNVSCMSEKQLLEEMASADYPTSK